MRRYLSNSPEAMARVIALSLLADGGLDVSELNVMERSQILQRIGVSHEQFDQIVHDLCEDMLQYLQHAEHGQVELDSEVLDQLFADITTPRLQRMLLSVMLDIVDADEHLSDGEAILVSHALDFWRMDWHEINLHSPKRSFLGAKTIPQHARH